MVRKKSKYKLTNRQEQLFKKYAFTYEDDYAKQKNVKDQKYVYRVLKNKSINETAIKSLLEMIQKDIDMQYQMKSHIENKAGFLMALWGILLGVILNIELPMKLYMENSNIQFIVLNYIMIVVMVCAGMLSLYFITQTITSKQYARYTFEERNINYRCAVDDKELFLVMMLEAYTNCWEKNESTNQKKAWYLSKSMIFIAVYIFSIMFVKILQRM